MNNPQEKPEPQSSNRWYDSDPILSRAMEQLRNAPDKHQAQVALNIIKIIVEHQIEIETDLTVEDLDNGLNHRPPSQNGAPNRHRRWYDVHETLSSAIHLLHDCPDDLQRRIIPSIAEMIDSTLRMEVENLG